MSSAQRPKLWLVSILLVLLACAAGSWGLFIAMRPSTMTATAHGASPSEPAALSVESPDELLVALQTAVDDATSLQQLLYRSNVNYSGRMDQFTRTINYGVAAADKLEMSSAVGEEQRRSADRSKFRLLYQGAKLNRSEFLPRLEAYVGQLQRKDVSGTPTELAAAALVELKYLTGPEPSINALPALVEYAKKYPQSAAGAALFEQLGKQFEDAENREAAMNCYQTAIRLLPSLPEVVSLRNRLANLERFVQAERNRAQAQEEKKLQIRRQLGGIDSGYFVIYAHDDKGSALYEFEYQVLRGSGAVVTYVGGLKRTWKWELVRHFPETSTDFKEATNLANKLTKDRTFIEYSLPSIPESLPWTPE